MPPKVKAAEAPKKPSGSKKPAAGGGKKWTTSKAKDKIVNNHTVNQNLFDRIFKDAPKMSLISISTMSDKFKIGGAIARQAMRDLAAKELIIRVGDHNASTPLYRGSQWSLKKEQEDAAAKVANPKKGGKTKEDKKVAAAEAADDDN